MPPETPTPNTQPVALKGFRDLPPELRPAQVQGDDPTALDMRHARQIVNEVRRVRVQISMMLEYTAHFQADIAQLEAKFMAGLEKLFAAVSAQDSVVDSVVAALDGLSAKIETLRNSQGGIDPAEVDQLVSSLDTDRQQLAEAVARNTVADPAAPAPAEPTPLPPEPQV